VMAASVISISSDLSVESMGSSFQDDPSESLLPPVYVAPMVSPFLCLDDSESDAEMSKRHVLPTPHDAMLTRWRSKVAS
ncbi:hypothetical protein Tco_1020689, partial [Tanacetum coccineum]